MGKDSAEAGRGRPGGTGSDDEPALSEDDESWLRQIAGTTTPARSALPMPGELIDDKYRLGEPLGRGGMGAVFRATHVLSEKAVALKWMLRAPTDEHARKRFVREARAAGRVQHPNVVDLYDVSLEGEHSYLVMELLHGESLRKRLTRGRLAACEAVDLLLPAMRGVAAAHRAGVVHRDLKPDNVFLCDPGDGSPATAKVLDFGISSLATGESNDSTLTEEGTVLGSPAYMSPEQIRNPREADARTDVYALGVVLYEALTGRVPFEADSYAARVIAVTTQDPEPPSRFVALPEGLEAVLLRALARDVAARHQDVDSLIAALQPFGSHAAALQPARPVRGSRTLAAVIALGVIVLLGALAWGARPRHATPLTPALQAVQHEAPPTRAPAASPPQVGSAAAPAVAHDLAPPPNEPAPSQVASPSAASSLRPQSASRKRAALATQRTPDVAPSASSAKDPVAPPARSGRVSLDDF